MSPWPALSSACDRCPPVEIGPAEGLAGLRPNDRPPGQVGTPIKTLQTLARDADPTSTPNAYAHVTLFVTACAIDSLPNLFQTALGSQTLAATGTGAGFARRPASYLDGQSIAIPRIPALKANP